MTAHLQSAELTNSQEAQRLAALRRYDVLDTPPDGSFDRVTAMAARLFSVPISIISLVDHDRICDPPPSEWSDLKYGLGTLQEDRDGEQTTYA
jgi:eukaryotic-like serine/threonine-protein kinase